MQAAKDTFLMTLAGRLAMVNPARTMTLDGASRAAVMALENETPVPEKTELETFVLEWEGAAQVEAQGSLMYMDCKVSYGSQGTDAMLRTDRGRTVTAMDGELMRICEPRKAVKCDYTQVPPASLGTNVFWTRPVMAALKEVDEVLWRTATVRLYLFAEVG